MMLNGIKIDGCEKKKLLNQKFPFFKKFQDLGSINKNLHVKPGKRNCAKIWLSWVSMINLREYIIQRVLYYYRIWFSIIKWIVVLVTSWVITTAQSAPGWILTLPRRAFLKKGSMWSSSGMYLLMIFLHQPRFSLKFSGISPSLATFFGGRKVVWGFLGLPNQTPSIRGDSTMKLAEHKEPWVAKRGGRSWLVHFAGS